MSGLKQQIKFVGLCRQCENELFGTRSKDFCDLPQSRRIVFCYGCGQCRVNQLGECLDHKHGWSMWEHVWHWLTGITPERLSG